MKYSIGRALMACTLIAVLGTGISKAAMEQPRVLAATSSAEITQSQPATQATLLTDAELGRIVGGNMETGCGPSDGCYRCCLNLWIIEICVTVCIPILF